MREEQHGREEDCEVFYHAAPAVEVAAGTFSHGIDPGANVWCQYDQGFYTFRNRQDAERWAKLKPVLQGVSQDYVVLEFRIPRPIWDGLRRHRVPDESSWALPEEWLTEYDVLEGYFGPHGMAGPLEGAWQVKFNPHTYALSRPPFVRPIP